MKYVVAMMMVFTLGLAACGNDEPETDAFEPESNVDVPESVDAEARAELMNDEGNSVGVASFILSPDGKLFIEASVSGMEQGFHGFHIHEAPSCEHDHSDGAFTSAEGHYNPDDADHGAHAGDMPPLYVNEDGTAQMTFSYDRLDAEALIGEASVMIHEGPDNLGHIPDRYQSSEQDESGPDEETLSTGDAGDRVACGVVEAAQ
ncbi:superoxide dismutase family protein [Alkalicoccobacillus plakortidis]|uniref:Superoxide dismutase [Cu-Zn] n=1 Tax=Alkalicoccobacillus plakortidis TaxID=444060 RepID=A0ABT0XHY8_9BACI|nr:superoxide dismutase family protein [Alkalicoccobacillus plakortidis]MCM2675531.1 superoxide dismutase family protein [Alkalicoccobacillus plakortidis]